MERVVIYDLDGTLIDSAWIVADILNRMRKGENVAPLTIEDVRLLTSLGGENMIKMALNCPTNKIGEKLAEFREAYRLTTTTEALVFPGVKAVLHHLKTHGIGVALCTNKPENLAIKTLKETKLYDVFDYAVYYNESGFNKPHPEPLNKIVDYFDLPKSHFVFIGDTETDLLAAQRAHLEFIFFDSGYDLTVNSRENLRTITNHLEFLKS